MELRDKPTARATLSQKIYVSSGGCEIKNFNLVHHAASQRSFVQCDRINSHCGRAIPPVFLCKNAVTQQPGYPVSLVSALLNQALLKTHGAKIRLERFNLAARDNGPNIAIRSHEPPITGGQTVNVAQVAILIKDIVARTDCMDMQPRAWRHGVAFNIIAQ